MKNEGIEGYNYIFHNGKYYAGCRRCGGTGQYSFNGFDSICYACGGVLAGRLGRKVGDRDAAVKHAKTRAKARAGRIAAAEAKRLERVAKRDAKVDALRRKYPEVMAYLESLEVDEWGNVATRNPFVTSMRDKALNEGFMTEPMAAAMVRVIDKEKAEAARPKTEVIEGRGVITGTIVSAKSVETQWGLSQKVTIADDRGFRIYGSLAGNLADEAYNEWRESVKAVYDYGPECWLDHLKGKRLTFTARVERSREDVEFGFFTRPNKAEFIKD